MAPKTTQFSDPRDAKIKKLEEELYRASEAVIRLTPAPYRELLKGYYGCRSVDDVDAWQADATKRIIALTEETAALTPPKPGTFLHGRAFCPLCGGGGHGRYAPGYELPEGLRRHLEGWGSRVRQCDVIRAARQLGLS